MNCLGFDFASSGSSEGSNSVKKFIELEIDSYDIKSTDPSKMLDYSQLIIGCPTWNVGELQEDWEKESEYSPINSPFIHEEKSPSIYSPEQTQKPSMSPKRRSSLQFINEASKNSTKIN